MHKHIFLRLTLASLSVRKNINKKLNQSALLISSIFSSVFNVGGIEH